MAVDASSVAGEQDHASREGRKNGGRSTSSSWRTAWPPALSVLPLGLLVMASWTGRYVRPSADEWCFLPSVRDHGISGLIGKFYFTDNGRVGNGLLVGLYAQFPVAGHQWFGLVSGVLMLVLLWALTVQLLRRADLEVPRGLPLLVASMITAVFLFATPNTYKTFYWPAASVSHTVAPVLACAVAIPLLRAGGRRSRIAALAVVFTAGVFMGTLSEEASVVALVVLSCVVLFAHRLFAERVRAFARRWSLLGMAGVIIGTVVLMTSPGSRNRREHYGADRASMLAPESLLGSLRGYGQILETILTTWQYTGAVAAGVLLGLLARGHARRPAVLLPCRPLLLAALGSAAFLVSGYLCTVITYPVFGADVVTTERTWNDYLLLYVMLLVGAGAFIGRSLRLRVRRTGVVAAGAAAVCAAAVLGLVGPLNGLGNAMQVRAEKWDRQDRYLRGQAAHGAKVAPYTPVSVAWMLEPFSNHGRRVWPAQCVADYYHLDKVTYAPQRP
ncbi:hypothetical protein FBY35_0510 [Streptomyces sp. SLBN-118]|uniref:DUF6056 family protein n=1 Tax=Streptomyces sp. SLBN-118 TaxID=2768454 RepID=UPI00114F6D22|nr:DUF6056 family protein [Streptomyces sp. SLBN-118]TQK50192.1 hypothetical protein FBY35_0510 [Streptomyces sp. SLBN-118]